MHKTLPAFTFNLADDCDFSGGTFDAAADTCKRRSHKSSSMLD